MANRSCLALPLSLLVSLGACHAPLPMAMPAASGHGLERIWIESLGLE